MLIKGELKFIEILVRVKEINQEKLQEVKEQLIRGDKYEMMWRDLDKYVNGKVDIKIPDEYRGYKGGILKYLMIKTKEKYFKPEFTSNFIKGVEKGIELGLKFKVIKEILRGVSNEGKRD